MDQAPRTLRTLAHLRDAGLIAPEAVARLDQVAARYAIAISSQIADLIDRDDSADPIAAQFVPSAHELVAAPEDKTDPIDDARFSPVAGIVHRYPDRCLLKVTATCPVYCRFCFRRDMIGPGREGLSPDQMDAALAYIEAHPTLWEVIVTGGDPFILSPRRIAEITQRLSAIDHVQVIRWHTRVPAVDPARVDESMVQALRCDKAVYVALHANHPREFTPEVRDAIARLVDGGIAMISQTVLLKGVNDDVDTLEALMRAFVVNRVKPYYLHHPDPAPGTAHFKTSIAEGLALTAALRARVSGLCHPHYVLDSPDAGAKIILTDAHGAV
jgi:lysine 2,3-aminomutase